MSFVKMFTHLNSYQCLTVSKVLTYQYKDDKNIQSNYLSGSWKYFTLQIIEHVRNKVIPTF